MAEGDCAGLLHIPAVVVARQHPRTCHRAWPSLSSPASLAPSCPAAPAALHKTKGTTSQAYAVKMAHPDFPFTLKRSYNTASCQALVLQQQSKSLLVWATPIRLLSGLAIPTVIYTELIGQQSHTPETTISCSLGKLEIRTGGGSTWSVGG